MFGFFVGKLARHAPHLGVGGLGAYGGVEQLAALFAVQRQAVVPAHAGVEGVLQPFALLQAGDVGMGLTESLAMTPAASVSGFYLSHPQSTYFNVGKIGEDQLDDLAQRSAVARADLQRWLAPNL